MLLMALLAVVVAMAGVLAGAEVASRGAVLVAVRPVAGTVVIAVGLLVVGAAFGGLFFVGPLVTAVP